MKTKKQKTIRLIVKAVLIAMICNTNLFAQAGKTESQGTTSTACGCPPVASRPTAEIYNSGNANRSKAYIAGDGAAVFKPNAILGCDTIWTIDRSIFVDKGNSLTIWPGTVIKGGNNEYLPGYQVCAILVQRGAKIFAAGTKECPIIFTTGSDPLNDSYELCNKSKWGGLVLLGTAKNNLHCPDNCIFSDELGTTEGVGGMWGFPVSERFLFGAGASDPYGFTVPDDDDNSGILKYVSIRHGGNKYKSTGFRKISGLSLGSIGRGTTIDHVEVISCDGDGFGIFGGTVNLKYCSSMFCNDDLFSWDLGYSGKMQFIFGVQADQSNTPLSDNGIEADTWDRSYGAATPKSNPQIYNATLIGNGIGGLAGTMSGKAGIRAKDGTQGLVQNSIFSNWNKGIYFQGADAAFVPGTAGVIGVHNSVFFASGTLQNPASPSISASNTNPATLASFVANGGTLNCPIDGQSTFDFPGGAKFDPIPVPQNVTAAFIPPNDGFFKPVTYKGAFSTTEEPWLSGWSISAFYGIQNGLSGPTVCPTDVNYDGTTNVADLNAVKAKFNQACVKP